MRAFFFGLFWLLFTLPAHAQYAQDDANNSPVMADLTISQTANAVVLVDHFRSEFVVSISPSSTAHCVTMVETSQTCTGITAALPKRICRKSGQGDPLGWEFLAEQGWYGQICVIAEDTGVVLKRSRR